MNKYFHKINILILLIALVLQTSCDLDINDNPNSATAVVITPDLILPAVVASTTDDQIYLFGYASAAYFVGHQIPGKGISGFGDVYTYGYSSSFVTTAWTNTFERLRNYQTIIHKAEANERYVLFGSIAHILKAYSFQLLVDAYGDVPYQNGIQGSTDLAPTYDKAEDVYKLLVGELDAAIAVLKENLENVDILRLSTNSDPVFSGNLTKWIQFANNIKLRLLIRASGSSIDAFVQTAFGNFSEEGFLKEDVLVNPGYTAAGPQNPVWDRYHSSTAGAIVQPANYFIPSTYVFTFYNGKKLTDNGRGKLIYKGFPGTPHGQLADETNNPASAKYTWFTGTGTGISASEASGIVKSRTAAAPLFLATETYFLLSEAALKGHSLDGDAKTNFDKGIEASFDYLKRFGAAHSIPAGTTVAEDVETYRTDNADKYLVHFDLATTDEQKLEAIITQKYLALNILNSNEAWNEYRRTGYPKISGRTVVSAADRETSFVSPQSQSTRPDGLPVRLVYPQTELDLNINTPRILNSWSNPLFWAK